MVRSIPLTFPQVKVTKEDIVAATLKIVQQQGAQSINARNVAAALGCSTQPIFSNFASVEELKLAVLEKADALCWTYIQKEIQSGLYPAYKASGMAYIRFAKEEKELFKLLYMRDRAGEPIPDNHPLTVTMNGMVQENTGLQGTAAELFHLEMWAYVHGIATMFATNFLYALGKNK